MQRIALKNFEDVPVLKFLQKLALDFPHICLQFSWDFLTDKWGQVELTNALL